MTGAQLACAGPVSAVSRTLRKALQDAVASHPGIHLAPSALLAGFSTGLGLILANGAQNAFVLRQGIRRERVVAGGGECLLLTWANPHVYLDTMVLLGSISTQYAPDQGWFGAGAVVASVSFFAALGYGARVLAPAFASSQAWVGLEIVVGLTMWGIAAALALG